MRVTLSNSAINVREDDKTVQVCATLLTLMEIQRDVNVMFATNNLEGMFYASFHCFAHISWVSPIEFGYAKFILL